ncbi:RNA-binding protein 28 [Leptinotarsa decemlineata]|uniref:RNA-binding protein 28 n=1 Tax=Leptinotarsa decemlineata TaxID=7539 RepID=UPI003D30B1C2
MGFPKTKRKPLPKEVVKQKLREKKKLSKQLLKEKRARLLIKNLSFQVTEENLKEYFEKYGEVLNVNLLKRPDGKLVGCGFVQFKLVQKAAKAKHHTNGKEFLGRVISVDFAKAKNKHKKDIAEVKKNEPSEGVEIKEEDDTDHIKIEENDTDENSDSKMEVISDNDEECVGSSDELEDENDVEEVPETSNERRPHIISNDVSEEKTVFVKNVPFDATNENLKQCMLQFGPVYYALVCIDKLTEHSKGTAFVKFVNKEDADKALNAGTELTLLGNILDCHPALNRNDVQKKILDKKQSKSEPKDSRNLYLVKEGVILAGSKAAQGVSATDMAKRLQIEQYKTQMLRNLNMFISRERIVVHNLPATWDDKKFRTLLQKYSGPGAVIKEARIMRDMKNLDAHGIGKSKEYGFATFTKHENALAALRNLNNNPEIFSSHRRPIIAFSIENKAMIVARQKRLEKSKMNNPSIRSFKKEKIDSEPKKTQGKISRKYKPHKNKKEQLRDDNIPEFSGIASKPGVRDKMRSRYKLQTQAKLHFENLKKEKKKQKNAKKTLVEKKKEFIKQPKQKINKVKESDSFSKLVNEYKKKLVDPTISYKSKWYQ